MVKLWKMWCRLCAREDLSNTHINIFLNNDVLSPISDAINKCFSVNINHHDDWPQMICTRCHQLVTSITAFRQRTSKVQAMFAELFNSLAELDPAQLKVQYDLHELGDVEMDLKLFANIADVQLFESKPSMNVSMADQMIDLEELEYIDEEMLNANHIKTENVDEDDLTVQEEEWKGHLDSPMHNDSSDEHSSEVESDEDVVVEPKKKRGRPTNRTTPKVMTEAEMFTCHECQKEFLRFQSYRKHMQTGHGIAVDPPQFDCSKCNKSFMSARRLENHDSTHLPLVIPCLYCDKKFSKSVVVEAHIRSVHMGEKPFICEECGKTYKTYGSLKEHKLTHTDDRPFKCSWCEKRFKTNARLKIHEDTHNETNYVCTTCGLQLNTRRTLRMHMVVHSDQKRHKCDYCGNEYKRAKALKNHLILHTGLKPYTCNFCEKSFANGSNCRTHKKKSHPIELAAMEAAGTKSVTTNIPKLEQLRVVTSNKTVVAHTHDGHDGIANDFHPHDAMQQDIQTYDHDPDFNENVSVISKADLESLQETDSPTQEHQQQSDIMHVFGSMPTS